MPSKGKIPENILFSIWRGVNYALLATCLGVLPLASIYVGYALTVKNNWNPLNLDVETIASYSFRLYVGFGLLTFFLRLFYIFAKDKEEREFTEFKSEIYFITNYAHSAWSIGASLACCFVGFFFLFPVKGDYFERYVGGVGLYFAILAITLGIHALFRKDAPILNISQFLDFVIKDLDNKKNTQLWIVYPALNIGFYRTYGLRDTRVREFKNALGDCAERLQGNAKALTFHPKYYVPLYTAYEKMVVVKDELVNQERIDACVQNAYDFIHTFTYPTTTSTTVINRRGTFYGFPHDDLPPFVLVIGNIVYFMITYSLPFWHDEKGEFTYFHSPDHKLAEMIVYRREDEILARTIVQRLQDAIRGKPPLIVKERLLQEPLPALQVDAGLRRHLPNTGEREAAEEGKLQEHVPAPPAEVKELKIAPQVVETVSQEETNAVNAPLQGTVNTMQEDIDSNQATDKAGEPKT